MKNNNEHVQNNAVYTLRFGCLCHTYKYLIVLKQMHYLIISIIYKIAAIIFHVHLNTNEVPFLLSDQTVFILWIWEIICML